MFKYTEAVLSDSETSEDEEAYRARMASVGDGTASSGSHSLFSADGVPVVANKKKRFTKKRKEGKCW